MKIYDCVKNMVEVNISPEFRLKNIDKTRNFFLEEIKKKWIDEEKAQKGL